MLLARTFEYLKVFMIQFIFDVAFMTASYSREITEFCLAEI